MSPNLRPLFASALLAAGIALAVSNAAAAAPKPALADVPPPPGLNDPGVDTSAPDSAQAEAAAAPTNAADDPLAPVSKPDARLVRDKASRDASATAQRIAASDVSTRRQGTDTVEEYRQKGHVWMIKIVPQNGPTQTFMANDASGRLLSDPNEGPISPVYYTLYEWQ